MNFLSHQIIYLGESLTSLLSFIDMLTGHAHPYRTVQARAGVDSVVLRYAASYFLSDSLSVA